MVSCSLPSVVQSVFYRTVCLLSHSLSSVLQSVFYRVVCLLFMQGWKCFLSVQGWKHENSVAWMKMGQACCCFKSLLVCGSSPFPFPSRGNTPTPRTQKGAFFFWQIIFSVDRHVSMCSVSPRSFPSTNGIFDGRHARAPSSQQKWIVGWIDGWMDGWMDDCMIVA
jgi:hypothetical protein